MKTETYATEIEIKEATERPDSIWLSFGPGKDQKTLIVDWDEINEINGDFGDADATVVVGIPLYGEAGNSEDILHSATMYVYNQIDIREKTQENKKFFEEIG